MIVFIEDKEKGYKHRTYENARLADMTIAFAADLTTSGEIMTADAAHYYNKLLIQHNITGDNEHLICNIDNELLKNVHSLNIAGNGMSRLVKHGITQEQCDEIVFNLIKDFIETYNLDITEIRSGGQTGADESGLKAALRLGIKAVCLCPNGWRFRTETCDISDETKFKNRFYDMKKHELF